LSGREGARGKIGIARIECSSSSSHRQKSCEEEGNDGKRPLDAFHGSTSFRSKKRRVWNGGIAGCHSSIGFLRACSETGVLEGGVAIQDCKADKSWGVAENRVVALLSLR
jgi:hypothetical protein